MTQLTLCEDGSREEKLRLTHDQSFNVCKGVRRSVNDRVEPARLTPARFGSALRRFLHYICELRRRFPDERLLMMKVDWLEVGLWEDSPPTPDGGEVVHVRGRDVAGGAEDDFGGRAEPVPVERRV